MSFSNNIQLNVETRYQQRVNVFYFSNHSIWIFILVKLLVYVRYEVVLPGFFDKRCWIAVFELTPCSHLVSAFQIPLSFPSFRQPQQLSFDAQYNWQSSKCSKLGFLWSGEELSKFSFSFPLIVAPFSGLINSGGKA